jgi:hypothetical protein
MLLIIPFFAVKYLHNVNVVLQMAGLHRQPQVNDAIVYGNSYRAIAILHLSALRN